MEVRKDQIKNIVKEVLYDQLELEEDAIRRDSHIINDLGADSLDEVEIIMSLEEEFDIEIPDVDAEKLKTVQQIITYIESKVL